MSVKAKSLEERLLAKKKEVGGCWIWTGAKNANGYGVMPMPGLRRNNRTRLVHRVAASIWKGFPLESVLKVLHRCDTPACFNPEHLFIGTQQDNVADCVSKKRNSSGVGTSHGFCRLTLDEVREIKQLLGVIPQRQIADLFKISKSHVSHIATGLKWRVMQ